MKKQVISFNTAQMLKDTPLNSWEYATGCYCSEDTTYKRHYVNDMMVLVLHKGEKYNPDIVPEEFKLYAPTQSIVQRYLREKRGIHIVIIPTATASWTYKTVTVLSERDDDVIIGIKDVSEVPPYTEVCGYDFNTYEDALEDALQESLKLIENE